MMKQADVVVVGSGPGGATVARQLARAGKKVILLERGKDYRDWALYGTYLGAMTYTDRLALLFTREGLNIVRPLMAGGATSMYCGCAARPPEWFKDKYAIDLDRYVDETIDELLIAPLSPELRGAASTRLAEAASELGHAWEPLPKFMNPARTSHFDCGAKCMLGCRCGAKWNAAEWVDEAVATGCCEFLTEARVDEVLLENRRAVGVRGKWRGRKLEIAAQAVVLAAGGIGTPILLKRAGLKHAGQGIAMDTTFILYGASRFPGNGKEPPMTYAWTNDDVGYMLSTLIDPWLMYPIITALKGLRYPLTWPRWGNTLGILIKLKDDVSGRVESERWISKPLTAADQTKLDQASSIARQVLIKAGAEPDSIFLTPARGTHPCATVRIGHLLDRDLQTEIENLYVCDASAFPEALDRPTVLTIIGLGKRLSAHLLSSITNYQSPNSNSQ
ncbi:MAG TPA: GMC family oxidoreductase N-terminal domain-containing protein [Anaerolineae bacterium]|nr:GMC family oxidoreductase N-terminal domain-containing protein [Anaerolineae bacterium]